MKHFYAFRTGSEREARELGFALSNPDDALDAARKEAKNKDNALKEVQSTKKEMSEFFKMMKEKFADKADEYTEHEDAFNTSITEIAALPDAVQIKAKLKEAKRIALNATDFDEYEDFIKAKYKKMAPAPKQKSSSSRLGQKKAPAYDPENPDAWITHVGSLFREQAALRRQKVDLQRSLDNSRHGSLANRQRRVAAVAARVNQFLPGISSRLVEINEQMTTHKMEYVSAHGGDANAWQTLVRTNGWGINQFGELVADSSARQKKQDYRDYTDSDGYFVREFADGSSIRGRKGGGSLSNGIVAFNTVTGQGYTQQELNNARTMKQFNTMRGGGGDMAHDYYNRKANMERYAGVPLGYHGPTGTDVAHSEHVDRNRRAGGVNYSTNGRNVYSDMPIARTARGKDGRIINRADEYDTFMAQNDAAPYGPRDKNSMSDALDPASQNKADVYGSAKRKAEADRQFKARQNSLGDRRGSSDSTSQEINDRNAAEKKMRLDTKIESMMKRYWVSKGKDAEDNELGFSLMTRVPRYAILQDNLRRMAADRGRDSGYNSSTELQRVLDLADKVDAEAGKLLEAYRQEKQKIDSLQTQEKGTWVEADKVTHGKKGHQYALSEDGVAFAFNKSDGKVSMYRTDIDAWVLASPADKVDSGLTFPEFTPPYESPGLTPPSFNAPRLPTLPNAEPTRESANVNGPEQNIENLMNLWDIPYDSLHQQQNFAMHSGMTTWSNADAFRALQILKKGGVQFVFYAMEDVGVKGVIIHANGKMANLAVNNNEYFNQFNTIWSNFIHTQKQLRKKAATPPAAPQPKPPVVPPRVEPQPQPPVVPPTPEPVPPVVPPTPNVPSEPTPPETPDRENTPMSKEAPKNALRPRVRPKFGDESQPSPQVDLPSSPTPEVPVTSPDAPAATPAEWDNEAALLDAGKDALKYGVKVHDSVKRFAGNAAWEKFGPDAIRHSKATREAEFGAKTKEAATSEYNFLSQAITTWFPTKLKPLFIARINAVALLAQKTPPTVQQIEAAYERMKSALPEGDVNPAVLDLDSELNTIPDAQTNPAVDELQKEIDGL